MTSYKANEPARVAERSKRTEKRVGIVSRAAAMLECFTPARPEAGLAEISSLLDLPKPTAFRIATVLTRVSLLEHNTATGDYSLGFAGLRLADALLGSIKIRTVARPVMEAMRDEINETVLLSIRDGDLRYNVDSVESTHAIGQAQTIGVPVPLYAGAASRVMLAGMSQQEFEAYIGRISPVAFSDQTITDLDELRAATEKTRHDGYATTSGEYTPGSHAVACLIDAPPDYEISAIHISIPRVRRTKALERKAIAILQAGVRDIALKLERR